MHEQVPAKNHEESLLQLTNQMQIELATRNGVDLAEWIGQNSASFRVVISDDPSLLERYATDPAAELEEIHQKIEQLRLPKAA